MSKQRLAVGLTYRRCPRCLENHVQEEVIIAQRFTTKPEGEHEVDGQHDLGLGSVLCKTCEADRTAVEGLRGRDGYFLIGIDPDKTQFDENGRLAGEVHFTGDQATIVEDAARGIFPPDVVEQLLEKHYLLVPRQFLVELNQLYFDSQTGDRTN